MERLNQALSFELKNIGLGFSDNLYVQVTFDRIIIGECMKDIIFQKIIPQ